MTYERLAVHPLWRGVVVLAAHVDRSLGGSVDPDHEAAHYAKQIANLSGCDEFPQFHRSRLSKAEARAYARLFAAAPEMLQVLKDYLEWGAMTGSDRDLFLSRFQNLVARIEDER